MAISIAILVITRGYTPKLLHPRARDSLELLLGMIEDGAEKAMPWWE